MHIYFINQVQIPDILFPKILYILFWPSSDPAYLSQLQALLVLALQNNPSECFDKLETFLQSSCICPFQVQEFDIKYLAMCLLVHLPSFFSLLLFIRLSDRKIILLYYMLYLEMLHTCRIENLLMIFYFKYSILRIIKNISSQDLLEVIKS